MYSRFMIELMILGFLASGPFHGFELRRQMERLHGHSRPMSDGTLYPAIDRLIKAGFIVGKAEPGKRAAHRRMLELTDSGKERLLQLLRSASGQDITDQNRYIVVLAFLSLLPDRNEQLNILQRRLEFLEQPESFFYDGDRPLYRKDIDDEYREGIFIIASATSTAERRWLKERLNQTLKDEPQN